MDVDDIPDPEVLAELGLTLEQWERELAEARERGKEEFRPETRIAAASYDRATGRVVIDLAGGMTIMVPTVNLQALADARPEDLEQIEILGSHMLDWPQIDQQVYIPDLLKGITGTRRWMAQQMGRAKSPKKAAAARENGKKGGRPRKSAP